VTGVPLGYQILAQSPNFFESDTRETLRENDERLAAENGLEIKFIRRPKSFRRKDKTHQVLKNRGDHPSLVWIFSVMEPRSSYRPWHDKAAGKNYLRRDDRKCLHYH
jgi:hypothetical protein